MILLIATTNPGKVAEIRDQLLESGYEVIGLNDLDSEIEPIEETGSSFTENALLKAGYYHSLTGLLTLADDSGLEVDALGGRPGVLSARYGDEGMSSARQVELLLDEMQEVPDGERGARFRCSLALVGDGVRKVFEGTCEGSIARSPSGNHGFGYDPIFTDPVSGRTFAELSMVEKAERSHRGKALREVLECLRDLARSG